MGKELTKKKIEEIAVNKVEDLCNSFSRLESLIEKNDRTPSIDGQIIVRKHPTEKKEDILDYISVQVKGTQVKNFSAKNTSFDVDIADLKNFLHVDGVMFFVVQIMTNKRYRIFYLELLPYDIHALLKDTKRGQKQKRIILKKLDGNKFLKICNNFVNEKQSQKGIKCMPNEDVKNLKDFKFTVSDNIKNKIKYLLDHDVYVKAYQTEIQQQVIVDKVKIVEIDEPNQIPVCIKGKKYFDHIVIKHNKGHQSLLIGKSIVIPFIDKADECEIKFCIKGTVYERIKDIEFLLEWNKHKKINIGDFVFEIIPNSENAKRLNEILKNLQAVKAMFEYLNVDFRIDLDSLSNDDVEKIDALVKTIIYKKGEIKQTAPIQAMKVSVYDKDIAIVVFKDEKIQKVYNYFELHKNMKTTVKDSEDNEYQVPCYKDVDAKLWLRFTNFNLTSFEEAIKCCPPSEFAMNTSNFIYLEMLKCFDITLNEEYLECCERTIKYLMETYPKEISIIVNYYQTIRRKRKLTKEEKEYLFNLKNDTDDYVAIACINIILDNRSETEYYLDRLSESEKTDFLNWPIYNLVNKEELAIMDIEAAGKSV